jgi:hypothetical protein
LKFVALSEDLGRKSAACVARGNLLISQINGSLNR